MLEIRELQVEVEWNTVLKGVSMQFEQGKNYCILGKNGSWKSSLALTVMWHPSYEITSGDVLMNGESIKEMPPHERAQHWIFLAFQTIPEIKGVKLFEFLRTIYNAAHGTSETFVSFKKIILVYLEELHIDKEFLRRDLNVGFSGGERRKIEILQVKLIRPTYIFLDEVDSGLDVDAFKSVAQLLQDLNSPENTFIIVTHYFAILSYIAVDHVYVLQQWELVDEGNSSLADTIQTQGFEKYQIS